MLSRVEIVGAPWSKGKTRIVKMRSPNVRAG